jgi:hypothetical protein
MARGQEISSERAQFLRQVPVQSCPAPRNEDIAEKSQEAPELEKCKSAPAVPKWLGAVGADIKVRNTFLHVEIDEEDDEVAFLQACRRRDVHSCPVFSSFVEHAPEESPQAATINPASELFVAELVPELSLERPVCKVEESETFRQLMASAVEKHHALGRRTAKEVAKSSQTTARSRFHAKAVSDQAAGLSHTIATGKMSRHAVAPMAAITPSRPCRGRRGSGDRLWCHMFVDPLMLKPGFDLVKKLIGKNGCNTRGIFESTLTKVRVRGKGSGHMEERTGDEARVPLMVALAAQQGCEEGFCKAFAMTKKLLQDVSKRFEAFLRRQGADVPTRPLFSLSETSKESLACLSVAALDGVDVRAIIRRV